MKNKIGVSLMIVGVVLLAGSFGLFLTNENESRQAGIKSDQTLQTLAELIVERSQEDHFSTYYDEEMPTVEIDGYEYIGYLFIPDLSLDLPVMAEWDAERLKISPCLYHGSSRTNNLIICAHNYQRHFKTLSKLDSGDLIQFTDMDGNLYEYEVVEIETLSGYSVDEMIQTEYDLTLFTCTYSGRDRITVRCERI